MFKELQTEAHCTVAVSLVRTDWNSTWSHDAEAIERLSIFPEKKNRYFCWGDRTLLFEEASIT